MFPGLLTLTATISCRRQTAREEKTAGPKLKAMQETILRMNEKNVRLTAENKSLKEDLENVMEESAKTKAKNGKECCSVAVKIFCMDVNLDFRVTTRFNAEDNSLLNHWISYSRVLSNSLYSTGLPYEQYSYSTLLQSI